MQLIPSTISTPQPQGFDHPRENFRTRADFEGENYMMLTENLYFYFLKSRLIRTAALCFLYMLSISVVLTVLTIPMAHDFMSTKKLSCLWGLGIRGMGSGWRSIGVPPTSAGSRGRTIPIDAHDPDGCPSAVEFDCERSSSARVPGRTQRWRSGRRRMESCFNLLNILKR